MAASADERGGRARVVAHGSANTVLLTVKSPPRSPSRSPTRPPGSRAKARAAEAHKRRQQLLLALAAGAWFVCSSGMILVNKSIMVDLQ